jgi:two-component system cell cycle response regulator CtrA
LEDFMRVLLVARDAAIAATIKMVLRREHFICHTTNFGGDDLEIDKLYDCNIILLEMTLPEIDAYEILRRLCAARVHTPILILSSLANLDYEIRRLGFNADDFLTMPFDPQELIARVVGHSRACSESTIQTGKLLVNLDTRVVSVEDQAVRLTGKEYGILELLSLRKGTTLTKEMFLDHLYGGMDEPELKIIDVFVCKLRKKLAHATGDKHYIETVWGRGYVLRDPAPTPAATPVVGPEHLGARDVGLARPKPKDAADVPATREIRVERQGTIDGTVNLSGRLARCRQIEIGN